MCAYCSLLYSSASQYRDGTLLMLQVCLATLQLFDEVTSADVLFPKCLTGDLRVFCKVC